MIIYFSGTGNSRALAKTAAECLGDELLCAGRDSRGQNAGFCIRETVCVHLSNIRMAHSARF